MNDKFLEAETIGRNKFKSFIDQYKSIDLWWSEGMMNRLDAFISKNDKTYGIEIKVRNKLYNTLILEQSKYLAFEELINNKEISNALYVNFINDDMYIFSYNKLDWKTLKPQIWSSPDKTVNDFKWCVPKMVYMLPIELATHYRKIDNKWKKLC